MWEKIRSADVEDAKAQLSRTRAETLRRQAEELESLDAQLHDVNTFEQVVAAFFEEYMNEGAATLPAASILEQSPAASLPESDAPSAQAPQNAPSLELQIRQTILPSLKILPRARRLIGVSSR